MEITGEKSIKQVGAHGSALFASDGRVELAMLCGVSNYLVN